MAFREQRERRTTRCLCGDNSEDAVDGLLGSSWPAASVGAAWRLPPRSREVPPPIRPGCTTWMTGRDSPASPHFTPHFNGLRRDSSRG
ncbi:MAG: hypothetical protein ACPIOQ_84820 [Promethearchaeia archaeon]